jgi:Zn-dependent protease with chaperone function
MRALAAALAALACALGAAAGARAQDVHGRPSREALAVEADRLATQGLRHFIAYQQRLLGVHERVRQAGAELCPGQQRPVLGLFAATAEELPAAYRAAARRDYGLDERPRVLFVLPDFPAARAGLRAGDVIVRFGGRRVPDAVSVLRMGAPGAERTIRVEIERTGRREERELEIRPGCSFPASAFYHDEVQAFAESGAAFLAITTGMLRFARSDDELAVVLGHELAHLVTGGLGTRGGEADADYLGCYFAARAGFDVAVAPVLWRRMSLAHPASLVERGFYSHPPSHERELALAATLREIQAKRSAGLPLEPERGT